MRPLSIPLACTICAICASCAGDVASRATARAPQPSADVEPVVGRLKTRDRTIDLTASAFGPGRDDVPHEAIAIPVMADIDADHRHSRVSDRGSVELPR